MYEFKLKHTSGQWRFFTDSSKVSWKAVLLHNGNKFPSIPVGHAVHMEEAYENLHGLLKQIRHEQRWNIRAGLKFIETLTIMQGGYNKFFRF
jgi:hypothetical protein